MGFPSYAKSCGQVVVKCAVAVLLAAVAVFAFPGAAHAKFYDVADSFPAMQDLGTYGKPITGDQLPDGAYKVEARTSSRMCIMYTNPADAEARDSKEQAIISVSGGQMVAVFYISLAYTHLYMGTQEEAAAETNADGTDDSAYIPGDPDEGYVPHLFTIEIDALNEPFTVATYTGGDKGMENGKWYTREFIFKMTDAELRAAIAAAEPEPEPESDPEPEPDPDPGQGDETGDQGGKQPGKPDAPEDPDDSEAEDVDPSEDETADPGAGKDTENGDDADDQGKSAKDDTSAPQAELSTDNVSRADSGSSSSSASDEGAGGGGDGDGGEGDSEDSEDEAESGQGGGASGDGGGGGDGGDGSSGDGASDGAAPDEGGAGSTGTSSGAPTLHGVRMTIADPQILIDIPSNDQKDKEDAQVPVLSTGQVVGIGIAGCIAGGIALGVALFAFAFEGPAGVGGQMQVAGSAGGVGGGSAGMGNAAESARRSRGKDYR